MKAKTNESTGLTVEKISKEILIRIDLLKKKLASLTKQTDSGQLLVVRCNGYYRELLRNYDREKFIFAPSDILIDHAGVISICLGLGKSPDPMEGQVLWFLSEKDSEPHYLSEYIPAEQMKKNYSLVLVA